MLLREKLQSSQIEFTKHFFKQRGEVFVPADHHQILEDALRKVESGEIKNLLINIFPRSGKTQLVVIDWMARCIANNPRAKFIHLSYSDELALDNSAKCRELVGSSEYQELWQVKIKDDADSKKKWYTEQGGGLYATAAGGPVTGFGAGVLEQPEDGLFYGAIIIDDPIKVDDAENERERTKVNQRLNTTIKSRRNSRSTPIIIVMQRLHEDDMSGFVRSGGMGEEFHEVIIPAIKDGKSIWPYKHTLEELKAMKLADSATFMAQYMQDPTPEEGSFFKKEWFKRFRLGEEPTKLVKFAAGDYAVTPDSGDWTEQGVCGFDTQENLWILDWWEGQVTLDKSIDAMMQLYLDHDPMLWAAESGIIRRAMEPFILKEQQRRRAFFKLEWVSSSKGKAANAKAFQALCSQGKVYIPYGSWGDDLITQLLKFTGKDDKRDDKVDVCGIFGRLLDQAYGPATYHEKPTKANDGYGTDDDEEDYNGTIPI
jgi:predicted phage terminase large subunit-like protein